jgi:hypothetical protein
MSTEYVSENDADSDLLKNSFWYKKILATTQRNTTRQSKSIKHKHTSASPLLHQKPTQAYKQPTQQDKTLHSAKPPPKNKTDHQSYRYTAVTTLPPTPTPTDVKNNTTRNQTNNKNCSAPSTALTVDPFYPKQIPTMTPTTISTNHLPKGATTTASCTLTAIARSISEKVLSPTKPRHTNKSDDTKVLAKLPHQSSGNNTTLRIPKIVPPPPTIKTTNFNSTLCTPITIRIQHPNPTRNGTFDHRRILEALLHAFQQVNPDSYLQSCSPSDENNTKHTIYTSEDIPTSPDELKTLIEEHPASTDKSYCTRILLCSNLALHQFKRNQTFVQWLRNENIKLDRNPLRNTLKPYQIGFFSHMTPRKDQTLLYENRMQAAVSDKCPPFFIQIHHVKAAYCITKVWNVYAAPADADEVSKELKTAFNKTSLRQFFPWKEYQSLQLSQQLTILQLHNTFLTEFRSLLIHGFTPDNGINNVMWDDDIEIQPILDTDGKPTDEWEFHMDTDDVIMSHESIVDRFHNHLNLKTTTISTYIQQAFLSGDKTPVFAHVYEPIQGIREVLVQNHHIPEALELIKIIRVELCRIMNHRAIIKNFPDYDDVILSTTTTEEWQPFDIQLSVAKTSTSYNDTSNIKTLPKRTRNSKTSTASTSKSYAYVTKQSFNHLNDSHDDSYSLPNASATSTITNSTSTTTPTNLTSNYSSSESHPTQNHIASLYLEIKTINDTLHSIGQQVMTHKTNQSAEITQLETRFNTQIQAASDANLQKLETTNKRFLQEMHTEQTSSISIIRTMLEEREKSIEQKMTDNFETLLSKLNHFSSSPTRKKHTIAKISDTTRRTCETDDASMHENDECTIHMPSTHQTIPNPYAKNTLQRRSSDQPLPTTAP